MPQTDNIQKIEMYDGGAGEGKFVGSTFVTITFQDGSKWEDGPDIPYSGSVTYTRQADGTLLEEVTYD